MIDQSKIKQKAGATYYVDVEPTPEEIVLFPLPVNFKIVDSETKTFRLISYKSDGTRLEQNNSSTDYTIDSSVNEEGVTTIIQGSDEKLKISKVGQTGEFSDLKNILPVSKTQSGMIDNTPLQELGGSDKTINGVRIGKGASNLAWNTVVGSSSQKDASTATSNNYNTSVGVSALRYTVNGYNTAIGSYALYKNTTGDWNTAVGASALYNNTTGTRNVALASSLYWNTEGSHNTAIGMAAGYANVSGSYNTFYGRGAGYDNGLGSYNIALGVGTMVATQAGGYTNGGSTINLNKNIFIGNNIKTSAGNTANTLAIDNPGENVIMDKDSLIYGGFGPDNRFIIINGRFQINPDYCEANSEYTLKVVAKPDGTIGFKEGTINSGLDQYSPEIATGDMFLGNPVYSKYVEFYYGPGDITPAVVDLGEDEEGRVVQILGFEKCIMTYDTGASYPPFIKDNSENDWSWHLEGYQRRLIITPKIAGNEDIHRYITGFIAFVRKFDG